MNNFNAKDFNSAPNFVKDAKVTVNRPAPVIPSGNLKNSYNIIDDREKNVPDPPNPFRTNGTPFSSNDSPAPMNYVINPK